MMIIRKSLLAILLSMCSVVVWAAPGDLDTSFGGGDGWVSHAGNTVPETCPFESVIQQFDGKLVGVCTLKRKDSSVDSALARYNPDGSLDTTFGGDGIVVVSVGTSTESVIKVIQQDDGKLVTAGSHNGDFALMRFNADGSLDTSFDGDGILQLSLSAASEQAAGVFQLGDGKLLVAGRSQNSCALVRLNPDGSLDTSFDNDGIVLHAGCQGVAEAILQSDEKVVLAIYDAAGNSTLWRFETTGALDVTFDGDGKLFVETIENFLLQALTQQTDGKLVVGGVPQLPYYDTYPTGLYVKRYTSTGVPDSTFDGDGTLVMTQGNVAGDSILNAIIEQSDGKLVLAGYKTTTYIEPQYNYVPRQVVEDFMVARINPSGSIDTSFSGDGFTVTPIGQSEDIAAALIQQSDGKLVLAGASSDSAYYDKFNALVRYNADGSLDASFDGDGIAVKHFKRSDESAFSRLIQTDGKLLVVSSQRLVRYNTDGTIDSSFGGDGEIMLGYDYGASLMQQVDGKLVVATQSGKDILVRRYNLNGSIDTSFSGDGEIIINYSSQNTDSPGRLLQQTDGKIMLTGTTTYVDNMYTYAPEILFVRLDTDGSLDTSFSGDGFATLPTGFLDASIGVAELLPDGSVVVPMKGSYATYPSLTHRVSLCRMTSDGSGTCSSANSSIGDTGRHSRVTSISGNTFVVEYSFLNTNSILAVRYNFSGAIDTAFGTNGSIITPYSLSGSLLSFFVQNNGKHIILSSTNTGGGNLDYRLQRFHVDGSLDTSFGNGGVIDLVDIPEKETFYSIYQLTNGDVHVTGSLENTLEKKSFVAKFNLLLDMDDDLIWNDSDNCPNISNADQLNTDGDSEGDACDTDDDNDGVLDINDAFPLDYAEAYDADGDTIGNNADTDDDNDGVLDVNDKFPLDASRWQMLRHDTDADNDSDLLTRSASTGTWTRHTIQNAAITGTGSMNAYTSSSVQYVAQLDANGDGDADILTRNTSTGAWYLHQVQNGAVTSTAPIYLYANLDQQFIGTGDFNNDGTDDVMLRSASAGYYTVFLLSNHGVSSTVFYNAWASASSVPQGIGDFNGDGTDDLLVRRTSDNLYFVFRTTNGATTASYCACNIWNNPDWTFQFAGDTNNDGIDDIVIRGTGATADGFWWNFRMNNFSSTQTTNLNTFKDKALVSYAANGDYNGDGYTDMLIRVNNGPVYVARIVNGLVSGSTTLLSNLPADQAVLR